jgi:hypothetical protein
MLLDAVQDHLIGRQIAFIGNALEDPSILGIIEIELPQIGNDLPMQRSIPEEVFVQPDGLVDLEAEGNKGHVLLSGYKIFTSFAFVPIKNPILICPALKEGLHNFGANGRTIYNFLIFLAGLEYIYRFNI